MQTCQSILKNGVEKKSAKPHVIRSKKIEKGFLSILQRKSNPNSVTRRHWLKNIRKNKSLERMVVEHYAKMYHSRFMPKKRTASFRFLFYYNTILLMNELRFITCFTINSWEKTICLQEMQKPRLFGIGIHKNNRNFPQLGPSLEATTWPDRANTALFLSGRTFHFFFSNKRKNTSRSSSTSKTGPAY